MTPTATHWVNYDVETRDGKIVALHPTPTDPGPSPIGTGMPAAMDDVVRLREPMARKSWLERGPASARGRRGQEEFVQVEWVDLLASELARVKSRYGNEAVYGGSYGWGSAGRFHHPQSQPHRFLARYGGFTRSVNTYGFAAAEAGVRFVNVSPLRDDAADFLRARWIAPRPNTDTALMLGIAHTLVEDGLHDEDFLARDATRTG